MRRLLIRHSPQRSIGLLIGGREVTMSVMASTPIGRLELARETESRGSGSLDEQLGRMLDPWLELRPRAKVVLGVPELRVFHTARAVTAASRKSPEIWLHEALQTQGIRVEDMEIDVVEATVGRKAVAGLVSCRRRLLAESLESLARRSARVVRAEPAPCALLRAASVHLKAPRSSRLVARFVLGAKQAMGMLVVGNLPLHWRAFALAPGSEATDLHSALLALRMQARSWQADAGVDAVLIQGRPDLATQFVPAELSQQLGVKVARNDEPGFDSASIAKGLALGGLTEERGFDLARALKPRESIGEIFPRAGLAFQAALCGGVVLLMGERARSLDASHATTRAALAKFHWLGDRPEGDLAKEKKALEQKGKLAEAFLTSRVIWSDLVRDMASNLPSNTKLVSLQGSGELDDLDGKGGAIRTKKTFVMRLESPVPPSGEMPREVDDLLESLRDQSRLKQRFPLIELKDLKTLRAPGKGGGLVASYNIVCLPSAARPAAANKD